MAGCKKLQQGLKCHSYVLKKHKYAEIYNYIVFIIYKGVMYVTRKINSKWQIILRVFPLICLNKMYVWFCVSVCLSNLLPGGTEIKRGTAFADHRPGTTK